MSSPSQPENNPLDTRIRDLPPGIRKIFYVGVGFMIYGLAWFFFGGHIWTDHSSKQFAAVGLIGMGLLYAVGGAQLMSIYRRWIFAETDELRARAKVATFVLGCVPITAAFMFNVMVFWHMSIEDSYTVLKVKATEPVKEELRWLLGDNYPEEQEGNIDPVSLEWEFRTERATGIATRLLEAYSPSASERDKEYFTKQLNLYSFEITWHERKQQHRKALKLDWDNAELYSTQETSDPKSYPMCNLYVPILNPVLHSEVAYELLFRGDHPDLWMVDRQPRLFNRPTKQLPPKLRIEDGRLVIRTNFVGRRWGTYCAINFPAYDRTYRPEPITTRSMSDLNLADHQLHFHLFPNLMNDNILQFQVTHYRRRATFAEFLEQLNKTVALDILGTQIRGNMLVPSY